MRGRAWENPAARPRRRVPPPLAYYEQNTGAFILVRGRCSWREGQPYPMMGRSSGSQYRRGRAERASADATVTVPILPVNIRAISTHSAEGGRLQGMPVLRPTVAKAEMDSNSTFSRL